MINLLPTQQKAITKLHSGSVLCSGVGTGKSVTALAYYYLHECLGGIQKDGSLLPPKRPINLCVITTARKRDSNDWNKEWSEFGLDKIDMLTLTVDSWNNIHKYENYTESVFYVFDEQRVVGSGAWVKSFLKITKKTCWILLSATPGDTWSDYIPLFIANGFYKNRTEFLTRHVCYRRFSTFPKIEKYVGVSHLEKLRRQITVVMTDVKTTIRHHIIIPTSYDIEKYNQVFKARWNPFDNKPIKDISSTCYLMRKVVNSDVSRIACIKDIMHDHDKIIIFYSFDYELDLLRTLGTDREYSEWNGHKHQSILSSDQWLYFVQYLAGAEAWNCIETNTIIFYSQNYSFKIMEQSAGRIDRLNTSYTDLYYYHLISSSGIDTAIKQALSSKKTFNEKTFLQI